MANSLFKKIFCQSSKSVSLDDKSKCCLSNFPFDSGQVQVLLYSECDSKGRKLLFDSNDLEKESRDRNGNDDQRLTFNDNGNNLYSKMTKSKDGSNNDDGGSGKSKRKYSRKYIEGSDGYVYKINKHNRSNSPELTNIGEMVFGSLAMSFRGTALKVHWLHTPSRMLFSQVFLSPTPISTTEPSNSVTSVNSLDGYSMNSFSMPFFIGVEKHLHTIIDNKKILPTNPVDDPEIYPFGINQCIEPVIYGARDSGYSVSSGSILQKRLESTIELSTCSCEYSTKSSLGSERFEQDSIPQSWLASPAMHSPFKNFSSDSSLHRRISRNILTSLENKQSLSDFIGFINDNYYTFSEGSADHISPKNFRQLNFNNETHSNPEIFTRHRHNNKTGCSRRAKLGLAVCIKMSEFYEERMEIFCGEHIALLESMLSRLRNKTEKAYVNHKEFMQIMIDAWQMTCCWINDFFTAPRIACPLWLNLKTNGKNSKNIAERFLKELCWLLSFTDTKDSNFFFSTVLTAVLTHHLGWVATVASSNSLSKAQIAFSVKKQKSKFMEICRKHPYNALWAQMGDLYGAIGVPLKLTRTIVYGSERNSVERLLSILTYFIRCGEVRRSIEREDFNKKIINSIIDEHNSSNSSRTKLNANKGDVHKSAVIKKQSQNSGLGGLTRTQTCKSKLNTLIDKNSTDELDFLFIDNKLTKEQLEIQDQKFVQPENVTTPENIEIAINSFDENMREYGAMEAVEIDSFDIKNDLKTSSDKKKTSFWTMTPPVKEGLSLNDLQKLQEGVKKINRKLEERAASLTQFHSSIDFPTRTEDECKAKLFYKQDQCVSHGQKLTDKGKSIFTSGVVFVLGDNERLINLKKSNDQIAELQNNIDHSKATPLSDQGKTASGLCKYHRDCHYDQQQYGIKKHSGVKFNFAQYPQIVTNYMKSKNLHLSNYGLFEKSSKLDCAYPRTSVFPSNFDSSRDNASDDNVIDTNSNCHICKQLNNIRSYQTPSNATELEFETDDEHYYQDSSKKSLLLNIAAKNVPNELVRESNKSAKCNSLNSTRDLQYLKLPISGIYEEKNSTHNRITKLKAGFIPSLFLNVYDHYVSDMVLQGTIESPAKWETNLRNDLSISSRSAALISMPAENLAIVADMTTWTVKLISSQTQALCFAGNISGAVGMSQLVSTMLEAVQAMYCSGISAFECIYYLESKLHEIYLRSESIAAFLLNTDFCSLSDVATALNLTMNDVPLLLSIASIHSPEISKKCGISFK